MSATCPKCQSAVLDTDRFCPTCGSQFSIVIQDDEEYLPLPGVRTQPDLRTRKRRRRRTRRWYRRPLFVTLMLLLAVLLVGAGGAAYYVQRQFDAINEVSTPPPVVSGAVFDEAATGEIDTSPALRALELADSGEGGEFTVAGTPAATPESEPRATPTGDGTGGFDVVDLTGTPRATPMPPTPEPTAQTTFEIRPVRESEGDSLNVLLMGVDARPGEAIDAEVRPDSLSVLHLDGETGSCRILSIPRDTRTELPGYGLTKVNHALALGGVQYEILVVEQLLGIEIDHFGLIDFAGIEGLVDAVGGVRVVNERAFDTGEYQFAEGEIALDGAQALAYSRFRYDEEGDFGRQRRQQQVIRALIGQTSGMDVVQGAPKLLGAVEGHFKSDLSPREMISIATEYRSGCTAATLETATLDGAIETHPDPLLKLDLSYVIVTPEEIAARVEWLLGEDAASGVGTPVATP